MADDRVERILDAAYVCFTRHGVRRTTMDDIAAAAEMSRPAVYQYVQNKQDAFRRLAVRIFDRAVVEARTAASTDGPLAERLHDVLSVKLEMGLQLRADSPHAEELLGVGAQLSGDLFANFEAVLGELAAGTITAAVERGDIALAGVGARDVAEIAVALAKGVEADLGDSEVARRRLHQGIELLVAGATVAASAGAESNPTGGEIAVHDAGA